MCDTLQYDLQISCRHCLSQSMLQCRPECSKTTISKAIYPYTSEVCIHQHRQGHRHSSSCASAQAGFAQQACSLALDFSCLMICIAMLTIMLVHSTLIHHASKHCQRLTASLTYLLIQWVMTWTATWEWGASYPPDRISSNQACWITCLASTSARLWSVLSFLSKTTLAQHWHHSAMHASKSMRAAACDQLQSTAQKI
jgi:hypothetical protein